MPVERLAANYLRVFMGAGQVGGNAGQVALQVESQGQEVGDNDDSPGALLHQGGHRLRQVRLSTFEESGLPQFELSPRGGGASYLPDRFVSRFNRGTVSEEDDAGLASARHSGCIPSCAGSLRPSYPDR